ncbi:MAG: hypothetical protein AAB552_02020 [Patescibacteria group bacterium]
MEIQTKLNGWRKKVVIALTILAFLPVAKALFWAVVDVLKGDEFPYFYFHWSLLVFPLLFVLPFIVATIKGSMRGLQTALVTGIFVVTFFYFLVIAPGGAGFEGLLIIPLGLYYAILSLIFGIYYLIVQKKIFSRINTNETINRLSPDFPSTQVSVIKNPEARKYWIAVIAMGVVLIIGIILFLFSGDEKRYLFPSLIGFLATITLAFYIESKVMEGWRALVYKIPIFLLVFFIIAGWFPSVVSMVGVVIFTGACLILGINFYKKSEKAEEGKMLKLKIIAYLLFTFFAFVVSMFFGIYFFG